MMGIVGILATAGACCVVSESTRVLRAHPQWPVGARRARADYLALRVIAGVALSLLSYVGLTAGAAGPGYGHVTPTIISAAAATLHFDGTDPIITGSVGHLFEVAGTFVGPNEAMKADRLRPGVDVLSLTKGFDRERTRIAALTNANSTAAVPVAASAVVADAVVPVTPTAISARIALAAVDPSVVAVPTADTAALNAIESAAIDPRVPVPAQVSQQLAYARDAAPVTVFPLLPPSKYGERDLNCLAQAIYFEARSETYRGQAAVAQVVMNRLAHPLYPKTICGVVFQDESHRDGCQFSFACDGIPETINEPGPWKQAVEIAGKVASGELYLPEVNNATHYHATYVYPDWAPRLRRVTKIGMHIFYKFRSAA
jgi:spore germination cell wall hydrolase CwlJ-like protein